MILKLKGHFTKNEIPDQALSGIGPQFTLKEFDIFTKTWDFNNLSSGPGNSKANGKAESEERSQAFLAEVYEGWDRSIPRFPSL